MKEIIVLDITKDIKKALTLKEFEEEYGELPFKYPERIYKIKVGNNFLNVYTKYYNRQNIYECDKVYGSWRNSLHISEKNLSKKEWEEEFYFGF